MPPRRQRQLQLQLLAASLVPMWAAGFLFVPPPARPSISSAVSLSCAQRRAFAPRAYHQQRQQQQEAEEQRAAAEDEEDEVDLGDWVEPWLNAE